MKIHRLLAFSIPLMFLFAGVEFYFFWQKTEPLDARVSGTFRSPKAAASATHIGSDFQQAMPTEDHASQISKLRESGYSEAAIQKIIDADASHHDLNAKQKNAVVAFSSSSPHSAGLGTATDVRVNPAASAGYSSQPQESAPAQTAQASMMGRLVVKPLAMLEPDPALNLTPQQTDALDNLYQNFVNNVGGQNQNPADPVYTQRWLNAQPVSDQQFRAMFGYQAFNSQQARASQEAMTKAPR